MSTDLPSSPAARAFFAALDGDTSSSGASSFVKKRIQTLGWRNRYSQVEFYPVTVDGVNFSVRQVQRGELEGTYGTGATVWPASVVLLKYLEKHADKLLRNKRIVDLGAGTGITSIAAALLGAKEVVCTDGEPHVVKLAVDNLQHAFGELAEQVDLTDGETKSIRGCPLHIQTYWWCSGSIHGGNTADVILVSDCVLPKLYPIGPLVGAIDELLVNPDAVAILSYEYRYFPEFDPGHEFRRLCALKGLDVESIPLSEQDAVYSVEDIEIWHVRRRRVA
jgi:predicted nicotinamide N-methyase